MNGQQQPDKARRRAGGGERRRFLQIASQISATIGTQFFRSMVRRLADALDADCLYIGEFVGGHEERVKILAAYMDHQRERSFDYPLAGSIAAEIAIGNPCVYPSGVRELFPDDQFLCELGAEACVGVPLNDSKQQAVGLIMAVYRCPLGNLRFEKSMLVIFAPRAAAELER
jgi:hypothetical protein